MQKGPFNLILTPLYSETRHLIESLNSLGIDISSKKIAGLNVFFIPQWQVWVTSAGKGKNKFAEKTKFWLGQIPEVKGIICAGSAGSLNKNVKPYDVVVADSILEHDFKSDSKESKIPEYLCTHDWTLKVKNKHWPNNNIHIGKIASGDEDIVDTQRAQQIASATGAIAVAWEGAGMAKVATDLKHPFLEMRAITDGANAQTYEDFKANLKPAMHSLAAFLIELL